jgi:hypothetical protein
VAKITLEILENEPLKIEIEGARSPEQALWMLATAQIIILTEEPEDEENVPELPPADGEEEEVTMSDVPE